MAMYTKDHLDEIYEIVSGMTLEKVKKEKATKLSRRTLKMIALSQSLRKTISKA